MASEQKTTHPQSARSLVAVGSTWAMLDPQYDDDAIREFVADTRGWDKVELVRHPAYVLVRPLE